MDFAALASFNRVAAHGGFGQASRATGQPKATLSRHVRELEEHLGVRLIERGRRSLRLTEEGAVLHARTDGLLTEVEEAARSIGDGGLEPRGRLRVSAPVLLAHTMFPRIATEFIGRHPNVQLELIADDRWVDPVADGFDVVVRVDPRPEHDLVGRRFLHDRRLIVAPPSLAVPRRGKDERPVPAVLLASEQDRSRWRLKHGDGFAAVSTRPVLVVSSLLMARDAVRAGVGAAVLPRFLVADDLAAGRLVSWGETSGRDAEVWVMHTSQRLVSAKVKAFVQFLFAAFPDGGATLGKP